MPSASLHLFLNFRSHLLKCIWPLNPKRSTWIQSRPNSSYQQVVIWAGLHVVNLDFSNEFPCSGIRVIHEISIRIQACMLCLHITMIFTLRVCSTCWGYPVQPEADTQYRLEGMQYVIRHTRSTGWGFAIQTEEADYRQVPQLVLCTLSLYCTPSAYTAHA